jgi:hypothetical protein
MRECYGRHADHVPEDACSQARQHLVWSSKPCSTSPASLVDHACTSVTVSSTGHVFMQDMAHSLALAGQVEEQYNQALMHQNLQLRLKVC